MVEPGGKLAERFNDRNPTLKQSSFLLVCRTGEQIQQNLPKEQKQDFAYCDMHVLVSIGFL
jgi:hypothetical protein